MERIFEKGFASESCYVLVHRATQVAKKEWSKPKNHLAWDEKKVKPQAAVVHSADPMDLSRPKSSELWHLE